MPGAEAGTQAGQRRWPWWGCGWRCQENPAPGTCVQERADGKGTNEGETRGGICRETQEKPESPEPLKKLGALSLTHLSLASLVPSPLKLEAGEQGAKGRG